MGCSTMSKPPTVTVPSEGGINPVIIRIVVDLPAPFGPRKPSTSPRSTENEMPSTARLAPKSFTKFWTLIIVVIPFRKETDRPNTEFLLTCKLDFQNRCYIRVWEKLDNFRVMMFKNTFRPRAVYGAGPFISAFCLGLFLVSGCRTAPLPPSNLNEPGWTVRQGQAVWHTPKGQEIAGDVLVATKGPVRSVVQFTKTPFTLVIA